MSHTAIEQNFYRMKVDWGTPVLASAEQKAPEPSPASLGKGIAVACASHPAAEPI